MHQSASLVAQERPKPAYRQRAKLVFILAFVLFGTWAGYRAIAAGLFQAQPPLIVGPFLETSITDGATGQSSIWVLWETPLDGIPQAEVQYGLDAGSLTLQATGITTGTAGNSHMHEVQLTALQPFTQYYYRVRTGAGDSDFSATHRFVTAPLPNSDTNFTFVTTSDEQPGEGNPTYNRTIAYRVTDEIVAKVCGTADACPDQLALLLSAGDNADQGGIYAEYKPWFDSRQVLGQSISSITALGNHDYYLDELEVRNWRGYHHFPTNGRLSALGLPEDPAYLDRFDERWYFVDYSNVRFVVLDSNGYSGPGTDATGDLQNAWLAEVLSRTCTDANIDFLVTMMHHTHQFDELLPTDHVPNTKIITDRTEQFSTDCNKPSVHLYGHSHHYNRGMARDHHNTYIDAATSGGNVESFDPSVSKDFDETLISEASYGFVRADVNADVRNGAIPSIRFRRYSIGYRPNGETQSQGIIDDFTITLSANQPAAPTTVAATVQDASVMLHASAYSDPENIAQQSAQWQVTTTAGDYSAPVYDRLFNFKNLFRGVNSQVGADLAQAEFRGFSENTTYFWHVRYRNQHGYWSDWSNEDSFTTGTAVSLFRTNKPSYAGGEAVTIEWSGFPGNDRDWVSIAPIGAPDNEWYGNAWHFTGGAVGGSHTFSGLPAGDYEARAYYDWPTGGYTIQQRYPFQVTGNAISVSTDKQVYTGDEPITVSWQNLPGNVADAVALVPVGAPGSERVPNYWTLVNADTNGSFVFPAQPVSGQYEARAHLNNSSEIVAMSTFTVESDLLPTPTATVPGNETCLLQEGFEGLPLQAAISETIPVDVLGWTHTPPTAWAVTNVAGMPQGVTEWQGWSFATLNFWTAADTQDRGNFTKASGTFAIADPDEWDDQNSPTALGQFDSALTSPAIDVNGVNHVTINFDSHFRQEAPQKAQVTVSFDGGAEVEVLRYDDNPASANGGADAQNTAVAIVVPVPAGASSLVIKWRLFEAGNNWFWAIDNIDIRSDIPVNRPTQCFDPNATPTPTPEPTMTATPLPTPTPTITPNPADVLFGEKFDDITLNAAVDEEIGPILGWSQTPPTGWRIVNAAGMPQGTTEWQGWSFATMAFWDGIAPGQDRINFSLNDGIFAVADPDEWDDVGSPAAQGEFDSTLFSPAIPVTGVPRVQIDFDSHYRQELIQTAQLLAIFDTGAEVELLLYDDKATSDNGGADVQNSHVSVGVDVPSGATTVTLSFRLFKARNNWYWAVDNLTVLADRNPQPTATPTNTPTATNTPIPTPTGQPVNLPLTENFDGLTSQLQPAVSEAISPTILGWTQTPPTGWGRVNAAEMPAGRPEWQGWSFTTMPFWTGADTQDRGNFTKAGGVFAVADPDEWDDLDSPAATGRFNSWLTTPPLIVTGQSALNVSFDSHYRQEDPQIAVVLVSFDGGTPQELLRYDGTTADDVSQQNLHIDLTVNVPAGANYAVITWQLKEAGNNWFWAIDNVAISPSDLPATPSPTPTAPVEPTATPTPGTGPAMITIALDAQPDSITDFRYQGGLGDFRLDDPTTDDGDSYASSFTATVQAGKYRVNQWTPRGWSLTAITCDSNLVTVNLAAGSLLLDAQAGAQINCTFVNERTVTILTRAYHDVDGDGRRSGGDVAQAGWTVMVYDSASVAVDNQVTNELGKANFNFLAPGAYTICGTVQAGWTNAVPGLIDPAYGKPCYAVSLSAGMMAAAYFGNIPGEGAALAAAIDPLVGLLVTQAPDVSSGDAGYEETFVDVDLTTPDAPSRLYLPVIVAE